MREPRVYGYARVTTRGQEQEGHSLQAQKDAHLAYFAYKFATPGGHAWGGTFVDGGISAYRVPLGERKAGKELLGRIRKGDHLILTRLDRAFRRVADGAVQLQRWMDDGITVHILNLSMDTSTSTGRLLINILLAVAEHEREMASERTREVARHRKKSKGAVNQFAGYGYKLIGPRGNKRVVEDEVERSIMGKIVQMHDTDNVRFEEIVLIFRKANVRTNRGQLWSLDRIRRAYHAELALRANPPRPTAPSSDGSNSTPP
jgi:DNA invertase Pin-like site-specific DNA recombinase